MSLIGTLTDWATKTRVYASAVQADMLAIQAVLDGGLSVTDNISATPAFKLSQQAQPCHRLMQTIQFPDIVADATVKTGAVITLHSIIPANAHLARAGAAWHRLSVANNQDVLAFQVEVAGFRFLPGMIPPREELQTGGFSPLTQLVNDFKMIQVPGRPMIPAMTPIPIRATLVFDGDTPTITYLRVMLEFNVEHQR